MSAVRRHRTAIAAVLCLLVAAALVLLALDARTWQRTATRDDLRFRALHSHVGLWQPSTLLPGDPAGLLLGTGGALRYRRALQLFWFSRIGSAPGRNEDLATIRAQAQEALDGLMRDAGTAAERSTAANLAGVLTVTTPSQTDPQTQTQTLLRATTYFQEAIALDPGDVAAKLNLELVLRLRRPGQSRFGHDARGGYGFGRGRGVGVTGSGY